MRALEKRYPAARGLLEVLRRPFARPAGVQALAGMDVDVRAGEVFGVLGPNGAGKTTFLKVLVNLVLPSSGTVEIAGFDLAREPVEVRRRVGYVPSDERSFFWRLSGIDNLRFFAALQEIPRPEAERRIAALLERFGMSGYAGRNFGLYSSGQKKMMTVVRALLPEPPILVFDEVTNSLDPPAAKRLLDHVRDELCRGEGRTILWATHRLEEVREICDRVLLVDRGQRRFLGTVAEFEALAAKPGRSTDGLRPLMEVFEELLEEEA